MLYSLSMNDDSQNNDIDLELEDELGAAGVAEAKIKQLREQLKEAQAKAADYLDGWQRCKADSVNLKKDAETRARHLSELLREELVHDIIPALDSFDMAAESEAWASVGDGWRSGMEHVRNQLIEALRRHGIERIGKVGESIDHALHEVVEEQDDVAGVSGTIVRILRFGYRTKEKVLRPAQVFAKR